MTFLSEDPTYLAGFLGLAAGAFLMALKVTQQGKYLLWALSALGLAVAVVVIERLWVTDNERIESVVYQLRRAALAAKPEDILTHLTPDVEYVQDGISLSGDATREMIRANLANASFDFVHIQDLQTSAGRQTRRGKAEFRIFAKGTLRTSLATYSVGTASSTWSLGFQETEPGVWRVNRITPVSMTESRALVPQSPSTSKTGPKGQGDANPRAPGPFGPGMGPQNRPNSARYHGRLSVPTPLSNDRGEELR
jgi:hypothetical protein